MKLSSILSTLCFGMLMAALTLTNASAQGAAKSGAGTPSVKQPLTIGDTFILHSKLLNEDRRINVYFPPGYSEKPQGKVAVMYMPDGGMGEDFLHVAGLLQIGALNQTVRPFLLVGIENTERRRDLTGPTDNAEDKKIAKRVGGSATFRAFLREELIPHINKNYRTSGETALIGESLAGLFVVETFLLEPNLFQHYIAFDPSLWWNDQKLLASAAQRLTHYAAQPGGFAKSLYFTTSGQQGMPELAQTLAETLRLHAPASLKWHYEKMPEETHATIFHPAALKAFRMALKPQP